MKKNWIFLHIVVIFLIHEYRYSITVEIFEIKNIWKYHYVCRNLAIFYPETYKTLNACTNHILVLGHHFAWISNEMLYDIERKSPNVYINLEAIYFITGCSRNSLRLLRCLSFRFTCSSRQSYRFSARFQSGYFADK